MSSLTSDNLAEIVRNRLNLAPNEVPRIKTLINDALKSLAYKVARRADFEAWRKEIAVTCTAGVITLADTSILVEVLLDTGELILNGKYAKAAPSFQELTLKMPTDVYRWSLRGPTKIYVTDLATGALGTVNQTGTVAFNATLTLSEMPDAYDEQLSTELMLIAAGKTEKPPAQPFEKDDSGLNLNVNA